MKPFNLTKALNGAPVVTRGGYKVKDLCYSNVLDITIYEITATIEHPEGETTNAWTADGKFFGGVPLPHSFDLFMDEPKEFKPDEIKPELLNKRIRDWI